MSDDERLLRDYCFAQRLRQCRLVRLACRVDFDELGQDDIGMTGWESIDFPALRLEAKWPVARVRWLDQRLNDPFTAECQNSYEGGWRQNL
jgi:hypothetical protein